MKDLQFYNGGEVIVSTKTHILTSPLNCWDMNYHLYDTVLGIEYLIDIDDVDSFDDIASLIEVAWNIYE